MPWDETNNEIRHRLEDPDKYETCRRKNIDDGVDLVVCKKKGSDEWEAQALRFSKDKFDMDSAKKWFEEHWKKEEAFKIEELNELPETLPISAQQNISINEALIEGVGDKWEVTIIKAGLSLNNNLYTAEVLQRAIDKFEGVQVFAHRDGAHVSQSQKSSRDLVGFIENVRFVDGKLIGNLNILPSAEWLKEDLIFLNEKGKLNLYQLSIDAGADVSNQNNVNVVEDIFIVYSVDIVPMAAAGGEINKLLESRSNTNINNKGGQTMEEPKVNQDELKKSLEEIQKIKCELMLRESVSQSDLPEPVKEDLTKRFADKIFTKEELDLAIKNAKDLVAKLNESAKPVANQYKINQTELEKQEKGLLGFFLSSNLSKISYEERKKLIGDIPPYRSIREAYVDITGDTGITGLKTKSYKLQEAITTAQFDQICANVINKALVNEYRFAGWDSWKQFVEIVPITDFKPQYRIRYGGYGNLPIVGQGEAYQQLTTPTDEQAQYTPNKRGGTEAITLEAIRNDDVGAIRNIPKRLAIAAARTLFEFVFGTLEPATGASTQIYDGANLYSSSHPVPGGANVSNTGTTAISTGLNAARIAMFKFPEANSYKRLGIRAKFVLVPPDLVDTAYQLVTASYGQYNETPTYLQTQGIQVIPIQTWTDTNDYVVVANPDDVVGFEIGFLDGKEEPEIFVSDLPNAGSWFTNDAITYKIKHVYGGAVVDWRAFFGQIVA